MPVKRRGSEAEAAAMNSATVKQILDGFSNEDGVAYRQGNRLLPKAKM
jgi:hypothetical protein